MILKYGSRGDLVRVLQRFLGVNDDGEFGFNTESAVKHWQQNHGLRDDGKVGPVTWSAMGIATTDRSERSPEAITANSLDIKHQHLSAGQYFAGPTSKEWLFLHHTAGWDNPYETIKDWGRDNRGEVATEFVIGGSKITSGDTTYDGEVVAAFPEGGYAWHLGTGNSFMHRNSVGIELCNFGFLTEGGYMRNNSWMALQPNEYYTYVGRRANPDQIVRLSNPYRTHTHWHRYSDRQIASLRLLIEYIANRDHIDVRSGLPELVKNHGAAAFDIMDVAMCTARKGLWSHSNVRIDKTDIFPQPELMDMLVSL